MIAAAIARALRDLAHPRVLAVLFLPMLSAIIVWSVLAFIFWDAWTGAVAAFVEATAVGRWLLAQGAAWATQGFGVILVVVLLVPATLVTAVLITEFVAMPVIVSVVARRVPHLEKRAGGTAVGSLGNAAFAAVTFALLWLASLPLWVTGIGAVLAPALTSAYLNQRLFRYDALSEHASREEYAVLVARNKGRLYLLGLAIAPLYYVPIVNLAAPVVAGLAFTHFCLAALAELRRAGETPRS